MKYFFSFLGYRPIVLKNFKIPHAKLPGNIDKELKVVFKEIFE